MRARFQRKCKFANNTNQNAAHNLDSLSHSFRISLFDINRINCFFVNTIRVKDMCHRHGERLRLNIGFNSIYRSYH